MFGPGLFGLYQLAQRSEQERPEEDEPHCDWDSKHGCIKHVGPFKDLGYYTRCLACGSTY